jgi:hypothetical protein
MDNYRVTVEFDLQVLDQEACQRLAHTRIEAFLRDQVARGNVIESEIATTPTQAADYVSQDMDYSVVAIATDIAVQGAALLSCIEIRNVVTTLVTDTSIRTCAYSKF